jgi:hypothetical protein
MGSSLESTKDVIGDVRRKVSNHCEPISENASNGRSNGLEDIRNVKRVEKRRASKETRTGWGSSMHGAKYVSGTSA